MKKFNVLRVVNLFVVLLISLFPQVVWGNQIDISKDSKESNSEEIMEPEFKGGWENLNKWLAKKVKYPENALSYRIDTEVCLNAIINSEGKVKEVWLWGPRFPEFDLEAYRLIKEMPKWCPARKNGQPIEYELPLLLKFHCPAENMTEPIIQAFVPIFDESKNPMAVLHDYLDKNLGGTYPGWNDIDNKSSIPYILTHASFPGGIKALFNWLGNNVSYPEKSYKENKEGRVIVKFKIEKDGRITESEVVNSVDPLLDAEALRVVNAMPHWNPACLYGNPVADYFNLPVTFRIPR